jgi:putative transposase
MPHSVCVIYAHLVFSTKDRHPMIDPAWKNNLYSYIAGIINNLQGEIVIINGTNNHLHILCRLPKDMDIATFLRNIKANSCKWVHQNHTNQFQWQEGYGAFSVGISNLDQVKSYISNQEEHHCQQDITAEFNSMLRACGIVPFGEKD